jgi:hypothetical protein
MNLKPRLFKYVWLEFFKKASIDFEDLHKDFDMSFPDFFFPKYQFFATLDIAPNKDISTTKNEDDVFPCDIYNGKYAQFIKNNNATLVWLNQSPFFTPNYIISNEGNIISQCVPFVDLIDSDALPSGLWMCSGNEDFTELIYS